MDEDGSVTPLEECDDFSGRRRRRLFRRRMMKRRLRRMKRMRFARKLNLRRAKRH